MTNKLRALLEDHKSRDPTANCRCRFSGQTPNPTSGATHFLNPVIVRERRGGSLPWARGEGRPIGRHTFYFPDDGYASRQ